MQVNLNLTQPQKTKNNPNFGINFRINRDFSRGVASKGTAKTQEVLDVFKRMAEKFPEDTRTFSIYDDTLLCSEQKYITGETNHPINNLDDLEKTIRRAVADYKAMLSLPKYTEQLSKKYGLNMSCDLSHSYGGWEYEKPKDFAKGFKEFAEFFSDAKDKDKYQIKFYNRYSPGYAVFNKISITKDGKEISTSEIPELQAKINSRESQQKLRLEQHKLETDTNLTSFSQGLKNLGIREFERGNCGM